MARDGVVSVVLSKGHRVDGFGNGADLVNLNEKPVAHALLDAFAKSGYVGYEEVVTHELALAADGFSERLPACPVIFGHAVFDGGDRELLHPVGPVLHELVAAHFLAAALVKNVFLFLLVP